MELADDREESLFREALQRASGPERAAFLDQACAGDPALRGRLEALLQAHESPDPFLEPPVAPANATVIVRPEEGPGTVIGRYKLLQEIGEGGCGVVYMAEQEAPMRRRVALKVIKLGMDTKQVVARFEAERQALAMMDHPNIAQVLDGGATETGRPYFVMELVRGVRITDYCDQHNLPTAARLKLFVQVCHAIQHAHQKGVVHRDIKPSNILVSLHDDVPVAKVIDFGIAKAIGHRLTDKTVFTRFEQFIGTPAYMSPEQAGVSGLDIDTRSDIYALGVLLYELLTGRTPFDPKQLAEAGLEEILRRIREEEPPKPSTRLSTLGREELTTTAQRRQTEPPRLISLLRGDLDWIVMKRMDDLAAAYIDAGNPERALPLLEKTLKLRKAKLGPDHPDTLTTMYNLGEAYDDADKPEEALRLYQENLQRELAMLGPDHLETLSTKHNLGSAYLDAGKLDQAMLLLEEVLKTRRAVLGSDHLHTLIEQDHGRLESP